VPRSASKAEVKQAFRRLARQWHPDVNPSPAASQRFQVRSDGWQPVGARLCCWGYCQACL